jgi:hypothetical protein
MYYVVSTAVGLIAKIKTKLMLVGVDTLDIPIAIHSTLRVT